MRWVQGLHDFLWGLTADWIALVGLFLTLGLQFQTLWRLPWALRSLGQAIRRRQAGPGEISSIAALMTALGGTLGIGHLSGMAISLSVGGPGVVPWMWVIALLGMATRFSETYLAVRFRRRDKRGQVIGGPMEAIREGLAPDWGFLAVLFALFGTVGVFGLGNGLQAESLAHALHDLSGLPTLTTGMAAAALAAWVLSGGLGRISRVSSLVVPAMLLLYLLAVVVMLGMHAVDLPAAILTMLNSAFNPKALSGGALALTLRTAIRTATLTNDSGLGTTAITFAAAAPADPTRQGEIAMISNLISVGVCTATALLMIMSGVLNEPVALQALSNSHHGGLSLLQHAFQISLPGSSWIASLAVAMFGFTTLVTFGFYGERCVTFLVGERGRLPFHLLWIGVAVLASAHAIPNIWTLANTVTALMVLPNLLALLLLSSTIFRSVHDLNRAA